jgi:hypothetical protein
LGRHYQVVTRTIRFIGRYLLSRFRTVSAHERLTDWAAGSLTSSSALVRCLRFAALHKT